ncbi:unnamed protein product [Rotaria sordida]|uniref:Choline/carnitine acyltransferase domain-containing protein n=1 Tax=Rotaria sordida TaxID=392033 RepID=A0A819BNQ0_9BILA|nr:unnamed protein product [Rotaria sordida]
MKQTARAANIVCATFKYRTELELQQMKPLMVQNLIPLCSSQYERQFNTVRIPGAETDRIVHYPDSHHIAVYHKGRWYQVFMYYKAKLLEPCELQIQLDEIIRDETPPADGEEHLAALTAGDRTLWATARESFFRSGCNRSSLAAIEKAAFVLILEDTEFEIGRVAYDGYGVSYVIAEDIIFFHISSRRSSPETDSQRFGKQICKAFTDMHALFEEQTGST